MTMLRQCNACLQLVAAYERARWPGEGEERRRSWYGQTRGCGPGSEAAGALPENGLLGEAFAAPPDDAAKGLADGGGRGD